MSTSALVSMRITGTSAVTRLMAKPGSSCRSKGVVRASPTGGVRSRILSVRLNSTPPSSAPGIAAMMPTSSVWLTLAL